MIRRLSILPLFLAVALAEAPPKAPDAPPAPGLAPAPGPGPAKPADGAPAAKAPVIAAAPAVPVKTDEAPHVVRVNVTNQPWDFSRPWGKRAPFTRRASGAVLPGNRVLVSAELVANANYLEFEMPDGGSKTPASIDTVDYECNLAVLKCDDDKFLAPFQPFTLTEAKVGDTLAVWQIESTGVVLATQGPMTTAEVSRYPNDD